MSIKIAGWYKVDSTLYKVVKAQVEMTWVKWELKVCDAKGDAFKTEAFVRMKPASSLAEASVRLLGPEAERISLLMPSFDIGRMSPPTGWSIEHVHSMTYLARSGSDFVWGEPEAAAVFQSREQAQKFWDEYTKHANTKHVYCASLVPFWD